MTAPLFLVAELPSPGPYQLGGAEGHHAADVQRLRVGEALILADGHGGVADAEVTAVGRGFLDLAVQPHRQVPPPAVRLVAVQALAKGDRAELAVQAMTEVGVDGIVPWAAARCVVRWQGERGERARQRWCATAREAAKQSRRCRVPEVDAAIDTAGLVARARGSARVLVLHEEASNPITRVELAGADEVVVVIGPEGGIAPEELTMLTQAGAVAVRLGENVLRTSTAGAAALAVLSARIERW